MQDRTRRVEAAAAGDGTGGAGGSRLAEGRDQRALYPREGRCSVRDGSLYNWPQLLLSSSLEVANFLRKKGVLHEEEKRRRREEAVKFLRKEGESCTQEEEKKDYKISHPSTVMAGQRRVVTPGPDDESLLYLQSRHISQAVWLGHADRLLRPRCVAHVGRLFDPPVAIVPYLQQAGFYGVSRLGHLELNAALVSAVVERWRPETHTFHTTCGECTITLQDVAIQLGLPCEGVPVSGYTGYDWRVMCEELLGIIPPDECLQGQRLSIPWLATNFEHLPEDADDEQIQRFTRAYILRLIGGYLMPDTSGHRMLLMYLPLLADFADTGRFSWGSAVLACLYRELCTATNPNEVNIGGCMHLLHLWAWDRFPTLAPMAPPYPDLRLDIYPVLPPLGFRWKNTGLPQRPPMNALRQFRILLDQMKAEEIIWRPYDMDSVQQLVPEYCLISPDIWLASVPIICFHIVEWHHADCVLRQFGRRQPIPQGPFNLGSCHTLQFRGKTSTDWRQEHMVYISAWDAWRATLSLTEMETDVLHRGSGYMSWYWTHTRRWIHPASGGPGFVADVAERLRTLSVEDPPALGYNQFRETVDRDCDRILRALGEHRDMTASQPALPADELSRPPIPQPRRGRRAHGFMSFRDPILPGHDDDDDRAHYGHRSMPSADVPSGYAPHWMQPDAGGPSPSTYMPSSHFMAGGDAGSSSFFTPSPSPPHQRVSGSLTAFLSEPFAFTSEYASGSTSHQQQGFFTPQNPIPPTMSHANPTQTDSDEGDGRDEQQQSLVQRP